MNSNTAIEEFHECLFNLELDDMPFNGPLFTWINRCVGDHFVARKLDRSLQNECAMDKYPYAVTEVLNPGLSYHCPLLVNLNNSVDTRPKRRSPFKFFNFWADHPAFLALVKDAWDIDMYGTPMYRLTRKLRSVKNRLKAFNFQVFANVQGSLWCAKIPSICSWSWRKILQLRDRIRPFIRHKVSNGVGTFLWHDFWNQLGLILSRFGDRIIYDSAIHRNAHVAEVIGGGRWNWPIANSVDLIAIKNSCGDYPLDDSREDTISWALTSSGVFTVTSAWNQIRPRMQVVDWHTSVWFPQGIRRHAFIVWLVIHDRLDTQDKLLKWGLINSMSYVFCRANVEDRNHLFFGCHFIAGIWMRVLRLCGNVRMPRNWENEFLWVMESKGKSFISIIKRIA